MKITKLIFLDIDGVLNSKDWSDYVHSNRDRQLTDVVDPNAVKRICNICEKTDARIIISSSWRTFDYNTTIQNLIKYKDFKLAYRNLLFEIEAYNNQNNLEYLNNRNYYAWLWS